MRQLAENYLEHIVIDFGDPPRVSVAPQAPPGLLELVGLLEDLFGPDTMPALYESLCAAADGSTPECPPMDEKVCTSAIYHVVMDFLDLHKKP